MILFGHPTGTPFSHHAALAHLEAARLEAFCVAWMPTPGELGFLRSVPGARGYVDRLQRRYFPPLEHAPRVEGRVGEWSRMARRVAFGGRFATEALSYEANDWLMRTMKREAHRPRVTAVHSYEDCSLWQFEEARRLGKACIYDLPIGYHDAWIARQEELKRRFADWLPPEGLSSSRFARPEQKRREIALADLVLVPCSFVRQTVEQHAGRTASVAPYGVDLDFWTPGEARKDGPLRFVYAGQCSLRKGLPVLIEAWKRAGLADARLDLVGAWRLSGQRRAELPANVHVAGPVSAAELRAYYRQSDVFLFPSHFEGFGLVILEAMACGIPVVTTEATAGPDILDAACGRIFPSGDIEALADIMRWFAVHRGQISAMGESARKRAGEFGWPRYRQRVKAAVDGMLEGNVRG